MTTPQPPEAEAKRVEPEAVQRMRDYVRDHLDWAKEPSGDPNVMRMPGVSAVVHWEANRELLAHIDTLTARALAAEAQVEDAFRACELYRDERDELQSKLAAAEARAGELLPLAKFGAVVLHEYAQHNERGDLTGDWLQDEAVNCNVMDEVKRTTPCGEGCACVEFYGRGEIATCYPVRNWEQVQALAMQPPTTAGEG